MRPFVIPHRKSRRDWRVDVNGIASITLAGRAYIPRRKRIALRGSNPWPWGGPRGYDATDYRFSFNPSCSRVEWVVTYTELPRMP